MWLVASEVTSESKGVGAVGMVVVGTEGFGAGSLRIVDGAAGCGRSAAIISST